MTWQELVVRLAEALAWPAVIVVGLLLFRRRINTLLPDLESFKAPGFEASFRAKLEKVGSEARQLQSERQGAGEAIEDEASRRAAEVSPRAEILEAWLELEEALTEASTQLDVHEGLLSNQLVRRSPIHEAQRLAEAGWLDREAVNLIADLRGLRNLVVHERKVNLTPDEATKFSRAARIIVEALRVARPGSSTVAFPAERYDQLTQDERMTLAEAGGEIRLGEPARYVDPSGRVWVVFDDSRLRGNVRDKVAGIVGPGVIQTAGIPEDWSASQ